MRFRFSRRPTGNGRRPSASAYSRSTQTRFAWLPSRLKNGTWIWLEKYEVVRVRF
ncbi:MAG: hypothetical protein QM690_10890 [Sphingobium sp.]